MPAVHNQGRDKTGRLFQGAVDRIKTNRDRVHVARARRELAVMGRRSLGNGVVTVRLQHLVLTGGVILVAVLGRRPGVDERLRPGIPARVQQEDAAPDVGGDHALERSLGGIRAVRCQVKHPVGTNRGDGALHRASILEIHGVRGGRLGQPPQAPIAVRGAQEQVHLVAVAYRSSHEIGTDESTGSGDQDSLGHPLR